MAIAIASCGSNPPASKVEETPSTQETPIFSSPSPTPSSPTKTPQPAITSTPSPTPTTVPYSAKETPIAKTPEQKKAANVTVYTSDLQCQELIAKKVSVSANEPAKGVVGKILAEKNTADINISSYRVNIKKGIATVDFRLSPNSQRNFTSLSSCEQFALFGSIRKTLTSNSKWNIKDVRFTEAGEEIIL